MSVGRAIYKCQSMILHGDKWKLQRLGALPYYYSCCRNQYLGSWSQLQPLLQNPWIYVSPIVVFGAYFAAFQQLKMVSDIISVSRLFQHKNAHKYGPIGSRQKCPLRNQDIALCNFFWDWQWKEVKSAICLAKVEAWDQNGFSQCNRVHHMPSFRNWIVPQLLHKT